MNRKSSIIAAALTVSLVSGSIAYATTVATSKVTACADKKSGILRVASKCKPSESSVPLISGSVQLSPVYTDARGTALNVLTSQFGAAGNVGYVDAIVGGKVVDVDGATGEVTTIGSLGLANNNFIWIENSWNNPITYANATCSGTPFLWVPDSNNFYGTREINDVYRTITTNPNYAGYFTYQYGDTKQYLSISNTQTGFAPGMGISHRSESGDCEKDVVSNAGGGYTSTGYQTIALNVYSGTRLPNFVAPIRAKVQ
jgi:hypothetical protein